MRSLRVLVTACGAPGTAALVRALRTNGERDVWIAGCDEREASVGRQLCDAFQHVPPGVGPFFAENVLQFCRRERIDAVVPQSGDDLLGLARSKAAFAEAGVTALVSSADAADAADDRTVCYARLEDAGVRAPLWQRVRGGRELARASAELGYPHRPLRLERLRRSETPFARVLDATADPSPGLDEPPGAAAMRLEEAVGLLPEVGGDEVLLVELCEGPERTIDGVAEDGRVLLAQPKAIEPASGGTLLRTLDDPGLVRVADLAASALGLDHFFGVRLVGDAVVGVTAHIDTVVYQDDLNLPYLGVKHALGEIDGQDLAAIGRRVRPSRRALRYVDQLDWDADLTP
jgi:hypothetical protein